MPSDSKYNIDMCSGPLFSKVILFSVPLILSGILQLMFNAADLIIIGQFASHESMAAVGTTMFITNLIVNLFIGLSIGTNVLAANALGAQDHKALFRAVHTSMAVSLYGGLVMIGIGILVSKPLLILTSTPESVLPKAFTYMWIYCCGLPFLMIYNFGGSILRAAGDTRRPLYYLVAAGIINVILNLVFVLCLKMDVAGVALATVISQAVSAALIVRVLLRTDEPYRLNLKDMRIDFSMLKSMLWIGLPAGIQGSFFSISNLTIQSSINSFGALCMAGNTAALSLEGIVYVGSYSYHQTAISFAGQNYGAGKIDRIRKSILYCLICSTLINAVMGLGFFALGTPLLSIFSTDPEVIRWGILRMEVLFTSYFLCGIMDVVSGALRGLGHSIFPAVVTLLGVCVLRVLWVFFIFPLHRSMSNLMLSYPVSWAITAAVNGAFLYWICRKMFHSSDLKRPV